MSKKLNKKNKVKNKKDISKINIFDAYSDTFKNIFNTKGRSTRKEFWFSTLGLIVNTLIILLTMYIVMLGIFYFKGYITSALGTLDKVTFTSILDVAKSDIINSYNLIKESFTHTKLIFINEIIGLILVLLYLINYFSLTIRRFHDCGFTGSYYVLALLAIILFGSAPFYLFDYFDTTSINAYYICFGMPALMILFLLIVTFISSDDDNKYGLNKYKIIKENNYRRKKIEEVLSKENEKQKEEVKKEKEKIEKEIKEVKQVRKVKTFDKDMGEKKESSLTKMDLLMKLNNGEITPEKYNKLCNELKNKKDNKDTKETKDKKEKKENKK